MADDRMIRALQFLAREFCPTVREIRLEFGRGADDLIAGAVAKGLAERQGDTVRLSEAGQRWALEQEALA